MTEFVRVNQGGGVKVSITPELAKSLDLKPLDEPASKGGRALPAEFPTKKTAKAAETSEKEKQS